jgi:formylglycine-generating enzyme required for sulfatase activity
MVVIPPGHFKMGSPASEEGRQDYDFPVHEVHIDYSFAVSKYPITRGEWRQYLAASRRKGSGNCGGFDQSARDFAQNPGPEYSWSNPGFEQADNHPVVCVTWQEAQNYAAWLTTRTGHKYRLLSEAEYEYINRAGSQTAYPWGATSDGQCAHVNGRDATLKAGHGPAKWDYLPCSDGFEFTSPVNQFPANSFGLFDTTGNVFSWTQDCSHLFPEGPTNGNAFEGGACEVRTVRGSSWASSPLSLRSAARSLGGNLSYVGLRLARTLP